MPERLTVEQRALKAAVKDSNSKAWAIGLGLTFAFGLFAVTNVLILKGGSNVGSQLLLAGVPARLLGDVCRQRDRLHLRVRAWLPFRQNRDRLYQRLAGG